MPLPVPMPVAMLMVALPTVLLGRPALLRESRPPMVPGLVMVPTVVDRVEDLAAMTTGPAAAAPVVDLVGMHHPRPEAKDEELVEEVGEEEVAEAEGVLRVRLPEDRRRWAAGGTAPDVAQGATAGPTTRRRLATMTTWEAFPSTLGTSSWMPSPVR